MADEIVDGGGENQEQNVPEASPAEIEAREQGWVPKEDFKGEEHKWVDAGEFLRRGELFSKIESQNKELKAIRETLLQFKDHHSKVQEAAYKKALSDLKAKKKEALLEGDADLVIEVDEQLDEVKNAQRVIAAQPIQEPQGEHPVFTNWKTKNSWYESNKPMRGWADMRGAELAHQGKSPDEVLRIVEKEVREEFPKRFENPNRSKAGAVESATQRGTRGGESFELTSEQRTMMNKFVKSGLMTEKEYVEELKALERK